MAVNSVDLQIYQVRVKWLLHNQVCYNVLNFVSRGSQDLITGLLEPILTCISTHLIPVLSNEIELVGADCKNITGSVAQVAELVPASDTIGTTAVDSLPSTNAAVIALRTSHVGRTGQGRMFIPGIPESLQATSQLDAVFIAAAVAFLACMFTSFHDSDPTASPLFHWGIYSRKDSTLYTIESYAPRPVVGTMRSRKVGLG